MFDLTPIDGLVFLPILLPLALGLVVCKVESLQSVRSPFKIIAGLTAFAALGFFLTVLLSRFSKISVVVLGGLFSIDSFSIKLSLMATALVSVIYVGELWFEGLKTDPSHRSVSLMTLLSLTYALIFSQNLIFIFVLAELILMRVIFSREKRIRLLDLQGTYIRLLGLIFVLGSIALNFGAGNPVTISFLRANAADLYMADHVFVVGALFSLAGLLELVWSATKGGFVQINRLKLIGFFVLLVFGYKLSSAKIFSVLDDTKDLLQWLSVGAILLCAFKLSAQKTLSGLIGGVYSYTLVMSFLLILPIVFDGEGDFAWTLTYAGSSIVALVALLVLKDHFKKTKGSDLLLSELNHLRKKQKTLTVLLFFLLAMSVALPVGPNFLIFTLGLKEMLVAGFYWVTAWAAFSLVLIWPFLSSLFFRAFYQEPDEHIGVLWL